MAPDLNSLPPSRSASGSPSMLRTAANQAEAAALRGQSPSPLSRTTSTSLQAAASVNAGLQQEDSIRSSSSSATRNRQSSQTGRRRSTVLMNLQLHDPALPAPGEMINEGQTTAYRTSSPHTILSSPILSSPDSHRNRTPSLGEIHQELEQEQEAQVNRLLQMIRHQQEQLQQLQAAAGQTQGAAPAIDESTPTSEQSPSFSATAIPLAQTSATSTPRSPSLALHPRGSFDFARTDINRRSRTPSRTASPRMRSTSISTDTGETLNLGGRDESAFYQAETQMMVRENQMLRRRIQELERQISESHSHSNITHEPSISSHLMRSTSVSEETEGSRSSEAPAATGEAKEE